MNSRRSIAVIAIVVLVLLVIGGLMYQNSLDKQRKAREEEQAAEQARIEKETETARIVREAEAKRKREETQKVPEPSVEPSPVEPVPPVPLEPDVVPAVEPSLPRAISAADCEAEPSALAEQNRAQAPEGMVYVSGGAFLMGNSTDAGDDDERPAHTVCLPGFYIDTHEVTNAQFKQFVDATGYVTSTENNALTPEDRTWRHPYGAESNAEEALDHPVVCISWEDANAYARWAGKRLPTEAEWEKAARGTDGRIYPWGDEDLTAAQANIADRSAALKWSDSSLDDTHKMAAPVGSFPEGKSIYGAEDMAGNVWEWCLDWWDRDYYKESLSHSPAGPQSGEFKVIRGGSWFYDPLGARTTMRIYFRPENNSAAIGFRCVKDAG